MWQLKSDFFTYENSSTELNLTQNTIMDTILSDATLNLSYGCNSRSFVHNSHVGC